MLMANIIFAGELEHGITHAHALIELERLGYAQLAKLGQSNHRSQMKLNRLKPQALSNEGVEAPKVRRLRILPIGANGMKIRMPSKYLMPHWLCSSTYHLNKGKTWSAMCKLLSLMK